MTSSKWHMGWVISLLIGLVACGSSTDGGDGTGGEGGSAGGGGSSSTSTSSGTGGAIEDGRCRSTDDCNTDQWEECLAPGEAAGCGACFDPEVTCKADSECTSQGEHFICEQASCTCSGTAKECKPGCQIDGDCGAAHLVCDSTHRCVAKPCENNTQCPGNFSCMQDADPRCTRDTCTSDAECDGYCVKGRCHDELGWCMPPAA